MVARVGKIASMSWLKLFEFAAIASKPFFDGMFEKITAVESIAAFTGELFKFLDPFWRNA